MPISPENKSKYPPNWTTLSQRIRFVRAQGRCECEGECGTGHQGRCLACNGLPHPETGSRVILTVAHLDHDTSGDESRLRAMCQRCHLAYDRAQHSASAHATRRHKLEASGQQRLPEWSES
jgi:hypothetical protein